MSSRILVAVLLGAAYAQQPSVLEMVRQASAREKSGGWAEAAAIWNRIVLLNPTMPGYWERMAEASKRAKDYPAAIRGFERALELGASYPAPTAYEIAVCYAQSGDKVQALAWLEKSLGLGFRSLSWVGDDPQLESLRSEPKFQALARTADVASMTREEGWRYDLAFLASELTRRHFSPFRQASRAEFDRAVADLHGRIPMLREEQIEAGLMRLARMMGDGHTYLRPKQIVPVPIQLFFFTEGLYVIRASPEHKDLVGLRVERVGRHTPQELLRGLDPVMSQDNEMLPLMLAPELITCPRILFGLGLIPDRDQMSITVKDSSGSMRQVVLKEAANADKESWASSRTERGGEVPLYLRKLSSNYWFDYVPDSKLLFFQFNVVREGQEPLKAFLDRLFQFIDEHDVERFVIDLRWNTGGTRLLNQQLIHRLIRSDKIKGKLFVVVGRYTFSAGMMLATQIEQNTDAVFVGEPTGSRPNFVGQDVGVRLPYSGMQGSISDLYWQNSAATDFRVWIAPQLYAPPSFALFAANRDPALDAILAYGAK